MDGMLVIVLICDQQSVKNQRSHIWTFNNVSQVRSRLQPFGDSRTVSYCVTHIKTFRGPTQETVETAKQRKRRSLMAIER